MGCCHVKNQCLVIRLPKEIDHYQAEKVRTECEQSFMKFIIRDIIFDFSDTSFMDSSGIGLVLGRVRKIHPINGKVYLFGGNELIQKMWEMSGILNLVTVLEMVFRNRPENEKIVRTTAAVFASVLDPTLEEISDFKTAVSEAVTNAIIHAYPKRGGDIEAYFKREDKKITVLITDYGIGIRDVEKSMQPLYSTLHTQERSGMGFTFMEAFADEVKVKSEPGKGTTVKLIKIIGKGEECGEDL